MRSLHDRPTVSMVWIRLLCNIIISIKFTCLVNPSHEVTCTVILPLKKYVRIICLTWISIGGPLGSLKPQFLSLKKRSQRIKEWQNLIWTDSGRLKFTEKMAAKFEKNGAKIFRLHRVDFFDFFPPWRTFASYLSI